MHTIDVFQTSESNKLLNWIHPQLVEIGEPQYTSVADLLMSFLIMSNKATKQEKDAIRKGKKALVWEPQVHIQLSAISEQVYPKGCVAKVARERRIWEATFVKASLTLASMGLLVDEVEELNGWLRLVFNTNLVLKLKTLNVPSPIEVPAKLYRFVTPVRFPTYAFIVNRKLIVDRKMNKWESRMMSAEDFCTVTGVPNPKSWSRGHRNAGPKEWENRVVSRSLAFCGLFNTDLYNNGKSVAVNVSVANTGFVK